MLFTLLVMTIVWLRHLTIPSIHHLARVIPYVQIVDFLPLMNMENLLYLVSLLLIRVDTILHLSCQGLLLSLLIMLILLHLDSLDIRYINLRYQNVELVWLVNHSHYQIRLTLYQYLVHYPSVLTLHPDVQLYNQHPSVDVAILHLHNSML